MEWSEKREAAYIKKLDAETSRTITEDLRLVAETDRLKAETGRLELEQKLLEERIRGERILNDRNARM